MMLVIGESGRIRETTLEDFVIPSINVLYCSLQNASHALVHLLKHTSLQSVLCNHVLLFNVKDGVFTDTIYDVITTFQLTTERFECNVSCRFTLPALVTSLSEPLLNSSSSEASRVMHAARISSYTHVIIVGANQTLSEPIIKIAEGEIILPCNATVTSRNLFDVESAFAKVPELYAEFKVCLTSNSRKSILIEDHTDQTAIDIVLHLCQVHKAVVVRLSGSMLKVESGGVHKSSIIAILFNITKAYDNQKCVFVITDLDVILGNVQAADADFEYKVTLIMELQRILEAGTKAVVVGICIDIKTILPPLASSFDFSYTIQRNAVDSQSTSINDAHVDSLYGMDDIMHAFDQTLLCPRVHKEAFKKFGLGGGVCNAVMLTGPSGKSLYLLRCTFSCLTNSPSRFWT
ncbi:hypothetical protein EON65_14505 [archaeon]|nr:MAG: hypothetical protein EON65_14505 [archaeon]